MNRALLRTSAAGVAVGALSFAIMHLTQSAQVDPVRSPVSSYALAFPGAVLFPTGVLGLALACAILAGRGVGLPSDRSIRILLGVTVVMLVGAAVFRTGTAESGLTVGAQIHRYTAGAAFVMLTVVAGLAALRMREAAAPPGVRRATLGAALISASMFAVTTVNTFLPDLADGGQWRGIPQRVLLMALSVLVWTLIVNSSRRAEPVPVPWSRVVSRELVPATDAVPAGVFVASES
ncbi:DUF998 domain-containing protein [Glycomyces xiaoerkulensis]|uniref:DUF998 domain-containing protein n=1 Tax=Glycomyces xiaoerkulensis TaxID=2038139 RepID=UPI000C2600BA|nr:DUF998 domain-containing protein [Glycomyces xiaoerkulensis]